jgi:hypothetical protein
MKFLLRSGISKFATTLYAVQLLVCKRHGSDPFLFKPYQTDPDASASHPSLPPALIGIKLILIL